MSNAPDPLDFLKAFWNPMGLPMAGMAPPGSSIADIDKRIADLKLVENWLNTNLSMLRMNIQALEMHKATLAAMQGVQGAADGAPAPNAALDAWMKMMHAAVSGASGPDEPSKKT